MSESGRQSEQEDELSVGGSDLSSHLLAGEADVSAEARHLIDSFRNENASGLELDEEIDDQTALRWRRALLSLSEAFLDAAEERRDLSPILLGALHNALEQLLIHGHEEDLMSLEEWLSHEAPPPHSIEHAVSEATRVMFPGVERRSNIDRRSNADRRQTDRRQN